MQSVLTWASDSLSSLHHDSSQPNGKCILFHILVFIKVTHSCLRPHLLGDLLLIKLSGYSHTRKEFSRYMHSGYSFHILQLPIQNRVNQSPQNKSSPRYLKDLRAVGHPTCPGSNPSGVSLPINGSLQTSLELFPVSGLPYPSGLFYTNIEIYDYCYN